MPHVGTTPRTCSRMSRISPERSARSSVGLGCRCWRTFVAPGSTNSSRSAAGALPARRGASAWIRLHRRAPADKQRRERPARQLAAPASKSAALLRSGRTRYGVLAVGAGHGRRTSCGRAQAARPLGNGSADRERDRASLRTAACVQGGPLGERLFERILIRSAEYWAERDKC